MLLFERGHHGHYGLDKPRSPCALGAKAAFAPQDTWANRALRRIVGRLDAFDPHERPQRVIQFADLPTDHLGFRHPTDLPPLEQTRDTAPNRTQEEAEPRVWEGTITDLMPPVEHLARLLSQALANR